MQKKYKAIMVSKTHWDREHSRPFEQFRWHLVYNVMDKLMEIYENVPEYKSFMFDGQSLGIGDYLEIRPEREPDIARYVKEGRLVVGPFFGGPDEFIPSGESLIRNLLMGHKIANQFGGVMKVGYNPDAFGHIAQLPQILRGFGINAAVFSRGVGEDVGKPGTEFLWEAPDGSEIIAVYNHYGNTAGLSTDLESALNQIKNAIKSVQPKELPYFLISRSISISATLTVCLLSSAETGGSQLSRTQSTNRSITISWPYFIRPAIVLRAFKKTPLTVLEAFPKECNPIVNGLSDSLGRSRMTTLL